MRLGLKICFVLFTVTVIVACVAQSFVDRSHTVTIVLPDSASPVDDEFRAAFSESSKLVFRSFNGEWVGMHCDADILMQHDGTAHLTVYGDAVNETDGSYVFTTANRITFNFPNAYTKLPDMDAYNDGTAYILVPADGTDGFIRGDEYSDGRDQWDGLNWTFRTMEDKNLQPSDNK